MAVRPFLTTGVALASAGAIVAAMPVIAPRLVDREIRVEAGVEPDMTASTTTIEDAFGAQSLEDALAILEDLVGAPLEFGFLDGLFDAEFIQGLSDAFFQGYLRGPSGFTGAAYYLSDNLLPLGQIDNVFFEEGLVGLAGLALTSAIELAGLDAELADALSQLIFEGGATAIVGTAAFLATELVFGAFTPIPGNIVTIFFGLGGDYTPGLVGVVNYLVDEVIGLATPPDEDDDENPEGPESQALRTGIAGGVAQAKAQANGESTNSADEGTFALDETTNRANATFDLITETEGTGEGSGSTVQQEQEAEDLGEVEVDETEKTGALEVDTNDDSNFNQFNEKFTPGVTPDQDVSGGGGDSDETAGGSGAVVENTDQQQSGNTASLDTTPDGNDADGGDDE